MILGVRHTDEQYARDVVGVRLKFSGPDTYAVDSQQGFYYTLIGGDVVGSSYLTFGSAEDRIVISHYDSLAKIVEGEMRLRLKNEEDAGDQVYFSVSRFRARILN